ncbi:MAG TPA: hypothetical protein VLC06_14585 [Polyangia bacterium]|nr:hypothetical protein [Polyangia bacterium]
MKTTLLLAAALLGAVGCSDNGTGAAVTYVYASAAPITVAAQTCTLVWGPEDVGNGWMHYAVDDLGGSDNIRAVIIPDSFFYGEACSFTTDQTVFDATFTGSKSGDIGSNSDPSVFADTYDFVVTCGNSDGDCAFNLTWTATY